MTVHPFPAIQSVREPLRFTIPIDSPRALRLDIVREVAARHGVSVEDLLGRSKPRHIAHARQEAYAAVKQDFPDMSLPQIGRLFRRDHTTILYGIRAHEARRAKG